ncbi:MAG: M14 family zinc carboxypeptidase [Christensenellales bacterium]|jgi:hypothetical protein
MSRERMLSNIPDYSAFLTVDELNRALFDLAEEYPEKVQVFEAGRSRKGRPMLCAKVGAGSKNALLYGCPHPNEPIGAMMCHYLARALAEDDAYRKQLDFTFYILPVSDVDGTVLNEGWFKGPFTIYNYARNFFRPDGKEQVEWTFPMEYKGYSFNDPLPETRALMKLIDDTKPTFIYSLHNGGFGGAFWYLSRDMGQQVYDEMYDATAKGGVPLDLGEPEIPCAAPFAPAVFKMPRASDLYDYYEKFAPGNPANLMMGGECSASYAGPDATILVTELPYFYDKRVDSQKTLDIPRKDAVLQKIDITLSHVERLGKYVEAMKPLYSEDNPFPGMLSMYLRIAGGDLESQKAFIEQDERFKEPCRESEAFSNILMTRFYQLLNWGLMVRSCEFELARNGDPFIAKIKEETEGILKKEAEFLEQQLDYQVIPIKKLVGIQLACGLCVLERLSGQSQ